MCASVAKKRRKGSPKEGRVEDGKAPKTTPLGSCHPEK
jgi:hypothetical protein